MRGYYIGLVSFFKTHNGYIKTLDFIYKVLVIFEKLLDVKTARFCGKVFFITHVVCDKKLKCFLNCFL